MLINRCDLCVTTATSYRLSHNEFGDITQPEILHFVPQGTIVEALSNDLTGNDYTFIWIPSFQIYAYFKSEWLKKI